jgi:hypothetical protein
MNDMLAILAAVVVQVVVASGDAPEQIVLDVNGRKVAATTTAPVMIGIDGEARITLLEPATHWAPTLTVTGGTVELPLWPAAELRGRVELPRGEQTMPRELTASIELRHQPVTVMCPVDEKGEWRCRLPELPLDVRLEAAGYAPHYVWDTTLARKHATTVPPLKLARGASVAGWITSEVKRADLTKATVRLSPVTHGVPTDELRLASISAKANARGFFQFTGVPTGTWRLWAEAPAHSRTQGVEVSVDGRREAMAKTTLRLGRLADVEIAVSPALDSAGRPWQLRLLRYDAESRYQIPVATGVVSDDGHWSQSGVESGVYEVQVGDGSGATHDSRTVDVLPDMAEVFITIGSIPVKGRVHIGDRGVAAHLKFTSGDGKRLMTNSNDEGEFTLVLPSEGKWKLEPKLAGNNQSFEELEIEVARDKELDVALPSGQISGRVVDESNNPVKAGVIIMRRGAPIADILAEDGTFELIGIKPGPVTIEARAKRAQATPLPVEIDEDTEAVTLVVRRATTYEAWLTTASGHPIAGAAIMYRGPFTTVPGQPTSSPSGRFSINAEPGTTSVTMSIVAPGFPGKLFELPLGDPSDRINIVMNEAGGKLIVRSANQMIRSRGAQAPLRWLLPAPYLGAGPPSWLTEEGIVVHLEPGEYTLCDTTQPQSCVTRVVAAGSVVRIGATP